MDKEKLLQNKILIGALSSLVIFVLICVLFFIPQKAKLERLQSELGEITGKIESIEGMFADEDSMLKSVKHLSEVHAQLDSKFQSHEEKSIGLLSDIAKKIGVEVISLRLQPKTPYLDENQQPITLGDKTCQKIAVTIELRSNFKDLVEYLETIREKLPAINTLERLSITQTGSDQGRVKVRLELNLYLLS